MMIVHVRIYASWRASYDAMHGIGEPLHAFCFDYDNPKERRAFGRQSADALRAGQVVHTHTSNAHDKED